MAMPVLTPRGLSGLLALLLAAAGLAAGGDAAPERAPLDPRGDRSSASLLSALAGLTQAQHEVFARGRAELEQLWTVAPSAFGRWGRGPTSNAETCADCHAQAGRGRPPQSAGEPVVAMLVRLSVVAGGTTKPHPVYGDQLQPQGVLGKVPGEGEVYLDWIERAITLADGQVVPLRAPRLRFRNLAFGPIGDDTLTSLRMAPPLWGLGLLEAVPEAALREIAARQAAIGIGGRLNRVLDVASGQMRTGRFGLKSNQPSLRQQIAHAYHADLGVTSALFPRENCPGAQVACARMPAPPKPELAPEQLDAIELYLRALAPPPARALDAERRRHGEQLFEQSHCAVCHVPVLSTGDAAPLAPLAQQRVPAYSDLLLHDMGAGLADGRPDFAAGPRDWRTAPLWGLGASARVNGNAWLLHDGRARDVTEAILWHGGQAQGARDAFARMSHADREALVAFVASL